MSEMSLPTTQLQAQKKKRKKLLRTILRILLIWKR